MGFPAKLLGPDEHLVLVLRRHAKVLFWPAVLLLVTVPAATSAAALVPPGEVRPYARGFIVVLAASVVLRWVIWPFLRWWHTIYAVTDRRLVIRSGVFSRSGHDMPLSRLNDVSFSHGVIGRMLGYGTLMVESAGERGQLVLNDVPGVEQVQAALYRLSDEVRDSSGARRGRDDGTDGDSSGGDTITVRRSNLADPTNPTIQFNRDRDR